MLTIDTRCSVGPEDFAAPPGPPSALDVRLRLVLCGNGAQERHATVDCPQHERSIPLEECMQCERCAGLLHDAGAARSRIICSGASHKTAEHSSSPRYPAAAADEAAMHTPISAIMARDVVCVRPDLSVEALTTLILERAISGAPVVDGAGKPIGVVSKTDLVREAQDQADTSELEGLAPRSEDFARIGRGFHECEGARKTVGEIMTPVSLTLSENASVAKAAALMAYEGVHRIPVLGACQEVVGIISSLDVLRWIALRSGYLVPQITQQQRA